MQVQNAIKKLEKAGFSVYNEGNVFRANKGGYDEVQFRKNGGDSSEVVCIEVRRIGAKDDVMTDYFAGTWCDNITQAISICH